MCGGTWPLDRGELSTRTDKHFSLDGADDLIDAALGLLWNAHGHYNVE
jgi:hypothetical protein